MLGLETLFCWVPWLVRWVLSWCPKRVRLGVHEKAVKIRGKQVIPLEPGTSWFNARWSMVKRVVVSRRVIDLDDQCLTTKDGRDVRVGGVVVYRVVNPETFLVDNEDAEHGVMTEAARVLRDFVRDHTFEEIQNHAPNGRNDDRLTRSGQALLGAAFGVRVEVLGFTNFVATKVRSLHHSGYVFGSSTGTDATATVLSGEN